MSRDPYTVMIEDLYQRAEAKIEELKAEIERLRSDLESITKIERRAVRDCAIAREVARDFAERRGYATLNDIEQHPWLEEEE